MDREIAQRMQPGEAAIQRVDAITDVCRRSAEELLAEIGLYRAVSRLQPLWPFGRY